MLHKRVFRPLSARMPCSASLTAKRFVHNAFRAVGRWLLTVAAVAVAAVFARVVADEASAAVTDAATVPAATFGLLLVVVVGGCC